MKEATNPIASGAANSEENVNFPSNKSLAIFPKINGTTIKNEKRAALVLSIPRRTEVEIVAPDLDIPGR
ncbi:MAG: hypothetical protein ACI897_001618, partial [Flavobacteriales bacterium]